MLNSLLYSLKVLKTIYVLSCNVYINHLQHAAVNIEEVQSQSGQLLFYFLFDSSTFYSSSFDSSDDYAYYSYGIKDLYLYILSNHTLSDTIFYYIS